MLIRKFSILFPGVRITCNILLILETWCIACSNRTRFMMACVSLYSWEVFGRDNIHFSDHLISTSAFVVLIR